MILALRSVRRMWRTRQAKKGLRGYPWSKPSACSKVAKVPLGCRYQHGLLAEYSISKKGMSVPNLSCVASTERHVSRETALNILTMSNSRSAWVGALGLRWHSRSAIVECITKSSPLGIPIPSWPWGRRNSAASSLRIVVANAGSNAIHCTSDADWVKLPEVIGVFV